MTELKTWLAINHADILQELEELLANPPEGKEDYDLVNHCDDNYEKIYFYFCEHVNEGETP